MKSTIHAATILSVLLGGLPAVAQQAEKPFAPATQAEIDAVNAAAAPGAGPPLAQPVFKKAPQQFQHLGPVGGYYPDRASRSGVNGYAVVQCDSGPAGVLKACKTLAMVPSGWGFNDASVRMAMDRYLTITPSETRPEGEAVRVLVQFKLPG